MAAMYQLTNCHVTINQVHYTALLHCNSLHDNNMQFTVIYCPGQDCPEGSEGEEAKQEGPGLVGQEKGNNLRNVNLIPAQRSPLGWAARGRGCT
jgi:hypothetical protein